MDDAQDLRERLIAVETTLRHLCADLQALRQEMQDFRVTREPYKKLIWGVIGAFGLFLILERMKVLEKLLRP